jgi:hypothetical protein
MPVAGLPFPSVFFPVSTVDILLVNDAGTGPRMARSNDAPAVQTNVPCVVQNVADTPGMAGEREATVQNYLVFFWGPSPQILTPAHRLRWIEPETDRTFILEVKACRRRRFPNWPDRVECTRYESGVNT